MGFDELSGVTGMMMTVRVADSGLCGDSPEGEAPFSAPQAKKILGQIRSYTRFCTIFGSHTGSTSSPLPILVEDKRRLGLGSVALARRSLHGPIG